MEQSLTFDIDLIRRYDKAGPRYTSYPTAVQFHEGFGEADYRRQAAMSNQAGGPLSLYFHIPFCDTVCFYCACNKITTKDRSKAEEYLEALFEEIRMQAELFDDDRVVDQLHWGGGTPTFLSHDQMRSLMETTGRHFRLRDDDQGEYSIEIDPREATPETIRVLREIGFNRISLGVQDFDPVVQKAVNRIQSEEETFAVMDAAREHGFHGISVDLIYGLPHQTAETFLKTVDRVIEASPDRLSVFNYAHLPERFKPQRRIREEDLPSAAEKLRILESTARRLEDAGYVFIGMDHFAKPDDPLAKAQRQGTLHRNFQGYSTHAECDMVAMGVSSIGMVHDCYSQNLKTLEPYYEAIREGRLPIEKGVEIDAEDRLRRAVITELMCHFELDMEAFGRQQGIDFGKHFAEELESLAPMEKDGLLTIKDHRIEVLPAGRLLIRNIAMAFDAYLGDSTKRFSRVI